MATEDTLRNQRLLEVALRVTDGLPVDWELERTGKPEEDRGLESLALIASIAAGHHSAESLTGPPLFVWGEHRVLRQLGNGRFGAQYIAWDGALQSEVILELGPSNPGSSGRGSRHLDKIRRLARIRHPNLVTVHGVKVRDGRTGIWYERLDGRSLEQDLGDRGPMGAREAALVGIDLCSALDALHAAGLVHGAIHTGNVIREGLPGSMRNAGRVVLGGLPSQAPGTTDGRATPPAIAGGTAPDDLRAMGILLHRLLTGCDPAEIHSEAEDFHPGAAGTRLRSIRPDLPMTLVQVIEKILDGNPQHRFRDAAAVQRALLPLLGVEAGAVVRRGRFRWAWRRALVAAAAIALVIGAIRVQHLAPTWLHRSQKVPAISCRLGLPVLGTMRHGWFGYYAGASAGDVNADGTPDLLWGSAFAEDGRGRAYILFGGKHADAIPDLVLEGSAPQENFGNSVAGLGDANGDGFADFAVAATGDDAIHSDAGRVDVYFGGPGLDTRPDVILAGRHAEQLFGYWISGVGDLNDDGFADLVIGAPLDDLAGAHSGRAFVFFGGDPMDSVPDLELTSGTAAAEIGATVAGVGDLNGDGHPDLAIGSLIESVDSPRAGRSYVYWGGPKVDSQPDLVLPGHASGEGLCKLAAAGDMNGDGFDDLAVGAEFGHGLQPGSGIVYLYLGGPTMDDVADLVLRGEGTGDLFGCWVAGPGDLNQDGMADLIVGARRNDANGTNAGAAYLFFGGRTLDAQPDLRFVGECPNAEMGSACGSAGDFFQDGFPDLFVSSFGYTASIPFAGRVDILDVTRYALLNPASERLSKGSPLILRWSGAERADVSISIDGRRNWSRVARRVGGRSLNEISIDVPPAASDTLFVRLSPTKSGLSGSRIAALPIRP